MASSQVEISSRPPFRNVLGDCSSREDLWERDRTRHKKTPKGTDEWARARDIVFETETSPTNSEKSRENRKIRAVSSLVQKWRDFEAESKNSHVNNNSNSPPLCSSRSNSSSVFSDSSTITEVMHVSNSDVSTEYERNRVANIIKRLTSVNGEECNDRDQNVCKYSLLKIRTTSDQSPKKINAGNIASPRIRGRHALNEVFMQMERDRYREIQRVGDCKVVSSFAHRSRLQKLLRVRFLRQGSDAKDGSKSNLTVSVTKEPSEGSGIMHLRDKFNSECSSAESSPRKGHRARRSPDINPTKEVIDHTTTNAKLTISTKHKEKTHPQDIAQSGSCPHTNAVVNIQEVDTCNESSTPSHQNSSQVLKSDKEVGPGSGVTREKTSYNIKTFDLKELADKAAAVSLKKFEGQDAEQCLTSLHDWIKESGPEWTGELPQNQSEWEDEEALNYEQEETYQDWISDVARPRSDWEDLRQERYQEMLDPFLKNKDIKPLLERRSVSTFLTSEMRDKIDQIMISHTEAKPKLIGNRVEHKLKDEKMVTNKIGEEENKSLVGPSEAAECFEQTPSSISSVSPSLQYKSWARNAIQSPTDESVSSPSLEQSPTSNFYTRDNKPSLELELIYGLKGHVEQIYQELSDLRKALSVCISMQQAQPQNLMKTGLSDSYIHSVTVEKGNESISKTPRKGSCCLCFKSEVDSLLYRCGHMCTCFKCAQDLQLDSGKCPICRASIQDVVRTCTI